MLIAHLSDMHIAAPQSKTLDLAPMAENLADCVTHINRLVPTPDVVVVTGDITHSGKLVEMEHAAEILGQLQIPFYVIPGNHDLRDTLQAAFSSKHSPTKSSVFIQYVIDEFPLRLIAIDSTEPGIAGGYLCNERLNWLDTTLGEKPDQPTVILMHHPPLKMGVLETDQDGFSGLDGLERILAKYDQIERILAGHIHLSSHSECCGTVVSTAPSPGMGLLLDLSLQLPSAFYVDQPSYVLHYWTPAQQLVSHTVQVRKNQKHHEF